MARALLRGIVVCALVLPVGCGSSTDNTASDDGGVNFADADPNAPDAGPNAGCEPNGTECNNCVDDDADTLIDGDDPECTGPLDDDEATFATGIPGDNRDRVKQDCFFDGDSGAGNDGCDIHVCCFLDGPCPSDLQPNQFDPNECTPTQECIDNCAPITPPGCDCFGCCTICNDQGCFDVVTHPLIAPDCTASVADDPTKCPTCTKIEECGGGDCSLLECILCPGQTEDDLPEECDGNECPGDLISCSGQTDCNSEQFCSNGCCINSIE